MNDETQKVLSDLAAQLGVAVEDLWPLLLQEQMRLGLAGLVLVLFAAPLAAWLFRRSVKARRGSDEAFAWGVGGAVVSGFAVLVTTIEVLPRLLSPATQVLGRIFG